MAKSYAQEILEGFYKDKKTSGSSRKYHKRDWDNDRIEKMHWLADRREEYAQEVQSQYNFKEGTRTYHQKVTRENAKGVKYRELSKTTTTVSVDKRKAKKRIKKLFDSAYEMRNKAYKEKKRQNTKSYKDKMSKGMRSMHLLNDDQRAERALDAYKHKGTVGQRWGKDDKKLNLTPKFNNMLLSSQTASQSSLMHYFDSQVKTGNLKSGDFSKLQKAIQVEKHKTRSMFSLDIEDKGSLLGEILSGYGGIRGFTPKLEAVIYNDAARLPTYKEQMEGNYAGVLYGTFIENGYLRKKGKFYSEKLGHVVSVQAGFVPGKHYLVRINKTFRKVFNQEVKAHAKGIIQAWAKKGKTGSKDDFAKLLGVVAQIGVEELRNMSGKDFGMDSHFANSWGWVIVDKH